MTNDTQAMIDKAAEYGLTAVPLPGTNGVQVEVPWYDTPTHTIESKFYSANSVSEVEQICIGG